MSPTRDRYLAEILGQPDAFRRAARAMAGQAAILADLAAGRTRGPLVLAGMGSSHDACLAAAAGWARSGLLATTVDASELLHVRLAALAGTSLLVIVSQSGESAEVVRLVDSVADLARRPRLLAVSNGPDSPLATRADLALDTAAGPEACPSTMTFAASLVALAAIGRTLGAGSVTAAASAGLGTPDSGAPVPGAADAGADIASIVAEVGVAAESAAVAMDGLLVAPEATAERLAAWLGDRPTIVTLGRGTGLAAAEMAALTLMEAAGRPAIALPTAEFRHGPLEIVGPEVAVILFSLEPSAQALDRALAGELAAAGAAVLLVGPGDAPPPGVEAVGVSGPGGILAPAISLGPIQLLARRLAHVGGRRPGEFTRAAKVTTRE